MTINMSSFESNLQTKLDNTTDPKEMLLLGKALESTIGGMTINDINDAGENKLAEIDNVVATTPFNLQTQRIFPNDRERVFPYDYSSDYRGQNKHTMTHMWDSGKISSNAGGVINTTSHMGGNKEWNYKSMLQLGWGRSSWLYGAKITVPAGTDMVTVEVHSGSSQIISLTDISTGTGVCCENGHSDNRFYGQHGNSSHRALCDGFGNARKTAYHHPIHLPVPNLSVDKAYVLHRGHGGRNQSEDGWISGVSFNKNPRRFTTLMGTGVHWQLNGGDYVWHSSWGWNNHEMVFIHDSHSRTVKFPVAPGQGDRKGYIIAHGEGHPQHLESVSVNGKRLNISAGHPTSPAVQLALNTSNYHRVDEFFIPEADIPANVLTKGGFVDVVLDNSQYGNHHYYFSTIGTYLPNVNVFDKGA